MAHKENEISKDQDGFILITSLLFLVIITLLALSGIDSATLQQKMATNSEAKSRSLIASNSALAHAESVIRKMRTAPPYPAKQLLCYNASKGRIVSSGSCTILININPETMRRSPNSWLSDQNWQDWFKLNKKKSVQTYHPSYGPKTFYRISVTPPQPPGKKHSAGRGLNPQQTANQTSGTFLYKITAYSSGPNKKAPAVTQVIYRKRY